MLNPDFRDILSAFNAERVTHADLATPGTIFQIGIAPSRIDVITAIDGVTFDAAWPGRIDLQIEGIDLPVIGRSELLANKRASGRPQDLADVARLERQRE